MTLTEILYGRYEPPAIPGRLHLIANICAISNRGKAGVENLKNRIFSSPRRDAIHAAVPCDRWITVEAIAEKTGACKASVQRELYTLYNDEKVERRKIVLGRNRRLYEYRGLA